MRIALGSTSKVKIDALNRACSLVGIADTTIITGTVHLENFPEQPRGFSETVHGSYRRAKGMIEKHDNVHFSVGIESGIMITEGYGSAFCIDLAVITILSLARQPIVVTSPGITFPSEYVEIAQNRGFMTTTVGSIIAEKLGGDGADPHAILTNGKVTRADTLVEGLCTALRQL